MSAGAVTRRFLPFRQAREYVQSLRLRSAKEYSVWSKSSGRPSFIPSSPYDAYREEFEGMPDFCGYKTLNLTRENLTAVYSEPRAESVITRKRGIELFLEYVSQYAHDFAFEACVKGTFYTILMRPKSIGTHKHGWVIVPVRMTATTHKFSLRFTYLDGERYYGSKSIFGFDMAGGHLYKFSFNEQFPTSVTMTPGGKYGKCRICNGDLNDILRQHYNESLQKTSFQWLERNCSGRDKRWAVCVNEIWKSLYQPLNLPVRFSADSLAESHNLHLDDVPTLHRVTTNGKGGQREVCLRKSINRKFVPLCVDDHFAFLVVLIPNKESGWVQGIYLFPKQKLADEGYLCDLNKDKVGGRKQLSVYPPWLGTPTRRTRRWHEWQDDFFVDCKDPKEMRNRFSKIFSDYKSPSMWA